MKTAFPEFPEACDLSLELPPTGEKVFVIGPDYKIIGYLDGHSVWRREGDNRKLVDVIDWRAFQ